MQTILVIAIILLALLTAVSLVRGIVAFLRTTKVDLETGDAENVTEMQLLQNKMMFNRIKYQAMAIVAVALLLAISQ